MNIQKFIVIPANGKVRIESVTGNSIRLRSLQKAVNGWIEFVSPRNNPIKGLSLVVNEEGRILNLKENPIASSYYGLGSLAGDVAVVKNVDSDTIGLSEKEIRLVMSSLSILN